MQALLIYMLIRLGEGEQPENNFDVALLSTMWVRNSIISGPLPITDQSVDCSLCIEPQDWQLRLRIAIWSQPRYILRSMGI